MDPQTSKEPAGADKEKTRHIGLLSHVAGGALINFSGIISRMVFLYLYTFLLARMLTVDELGTYFIIFTIINLFGLAAMVGLDQGVVRYVALYAGEKQYGQLRQVVRTALTFGLPVGGLFALLLIIAAPVVSSHFLDGSPGSINALRVFSLALPLMVAARLFNATTQGMHKMQYQVYSRDFGEQVSKLGLSVAVLAMGAGLIGVVWANVAAVLVAMVLSLFFALIVLPRKDGDYRRSEDEPGIQGTGSPKKTHDSPARQVLRYSYPLAFATILVSLWLQIDTLMLGLLGNTEDVGYYGVALKLSLFSAKIITAFSLVFAPVISDLCNRGKNEELKGLFITVSRWIFMICFPIFLVLTLFSDPVMRIFGENFETGGGALILLAIGQFVSACTGAAGLMVIMSGRSKLELFNVAVALALDVVLCLILIPGHGFIGAAVAHMTSLILANLMRVFEVWIFMHMFAYNSTYLKPLLAGLAGALATLLTGYFLIGHTSIVRIAVLATLLLLIYVLTMVALGLDENDKALLGRIRAYAVKQ